VLLKPPVGEIFHCCSLAAGRRKMYEKSHLFETVDDFDDFSRSYVGNLKILKQYCQDQISPLTARENFSKKIPAVSEIGCLIWGLLTSKMGDFS
jgi:hypothetical protein